MYTLSQLEKKQVGLRLPGYLISEIDEMADRFSINRTDIITGALRTYLQEQKAVLFYESLRSLLTENPEAGITLGKNCFKIRIPNSSPEMENISDNRIKENSLI